MGPLYEAGRRDFDSTVEKAIWTLSTVAFISSLYGATLCLIMLAPAGKSPSLTLATLAVNFALFLSLTTTMATVILGFWRSDVLLAVKIFIAGFGGITTVAAFYEALPRLQGIGASTAARRDQ